MTIAIRAKAAAAAEKAWGMTDAPVSVSIRRVTSGTYNPATGTTTSTTTDYPADAIITEYKQNEIDGTKVLSTDRKALVRQAQVENAGTLLTSDKFVVDGVSETIVNVGQDAVGVLWVLQVR